MRKRRFIKRFNALAVSAVLSLMLCACGSGVKDGNTTPWDPNATEATETTENTETTDTEEPDPGDIFELDGDGESYEEVLVNNLKSRYGGMTAAEITNSLTLEQKAGQMVMAACYNLTPDMMAENCYGCILSQGEHLDYGGWRQYVDMWQVEALASDACIPFIYGQDDVHGVNYCTDAVYFPHNIGMGAANDPDLMYEIGKITADEAKICYMLWNYAPCVAQSVDPRWGRTYESYGADLEIIKNLGAAYTRGLTESGVVACAKHFLADGNVKYGTGEGDYLIDRGDAQISEEEINALLDVYKAQIEAGAQTIMISHSALNGVKMHENGKYIMKLKDEMGFKGYIASDWESIQHTSPGSYHDQVVTAINSGIDMLMEIATFDEVIDIIVDAVNNGEITEERINDAVTRIIQVKMDAGLFEDPFCYQKDIKQKATGSEEYRKVAEQAVEESLVLLKNDNKVLPLKPGTSVYITGPAADDASAQCGGWTGGWQGLDAKHVDNVTTIQQGLIEKADEYGLTVYTDPSDADKADVVLLCVGEIAYAEWDGDTEDLELCGSHGLSGNAKAIEEAYSLNKPVVTLIVAGRQVILGQDYENWDAAVMCYLPGSCGQGITNMLCGAKPFRGKLPSPWYGSVDQIGTDSCWLEQGYGLTGEE